MNETSTRKELSPWPANTHDDHAAGSRTTKVHTRQESGNFGLHVLQT